MPGLHYPGAVSPAPPIGEVFGLTSSPDGGWTAQQLPGAVYYNGKTYFGWVNGQTGDIMIGQYDHATETVETFTIDQPGTVDDHNSPAILVRESDKRILVAYCLHNGPNMWLRVSTNPEDISSFAASVNLDPSIGASGYTYPQLFQLTGVTNDPIYLIFRDQTGSTGRMSYSKVTDAGSSVAANWSARTVVITAASTHRGYWYAAADATKIHIMMTDRDGYGSEGAIDIGHMYLDGSDDSWHKSDGTTISATKPFLHAELTQIEANVAGALVVDGLAGADLIFTYFVDNGDSTVTAWHARWDGAAWDVNEIYTAGHLELDRFYGYLAINRADANEVFSGVRTGTETSELRSYTTGDGGVTWDGGTDITTGSGDYNVAPIAVNGGQADMPVIWLRGAFVDSEDYAWAIKGLRR